MISSTMKQYKGSYEWDGAGWRRKEGQDRAAKRPSRSRGLRTAVGPGLKKLIPDLVQRHGRLTDKELVSAVHALYGEDAAKPDSIRWIARGLANKGIINEPKPWIFTPQAQAGN
jgi:hypothetical protein